MEDLTKSQLILLALFVSFVTSIATGIVTVTLMDQAPPGVTQTINRVVERTVQTIVPSGTQIVKEQVAISQEDFVVNAISKNEASIVSVSVVGEGGGRTRLGVGVMLSENGIFVTDGAFISRGVLNLRATVEGKEFAVEKVFSDPAASFALLKVAPQSGEQSASTTNSEAANFTPAKLSDSDAIKLGQTAIMLGGGDGQEAALGIVSRLVPRESGSATSTEMFGLYSSIETSTTLSKDSTGGPMITTDGSVMGVTIINGTKQFAVPSRIIAYILSQILNQKNETLDLSGLSATVSGAFSGSGAPTQATSAGQENGTLTQ